MKKKPTNASWPEDESQTSIDFVALSQLVFDAERMTIGGKPITEQMRDVYRDQAKFLATSQLFEVMSATAINEAAQLALKKSGTFEHVQFAKALDYWNTIMVKMVVALAK